MHWILLIYQLYKLLLLVFLLHKSIMLEMYYVWFHDIFYYRMFDFENQFLFYVRNVSCQIYLGEFIIISFLVMYSFTFFYIKYFEIGLEMSNYNGNKQDIYNNTSLSCNNSNQSGKYHLLTKMKFKILEQSLQ